MPVVRSDSQRKQAAEVTRTDSIKSERSDKKVSFNKDVGIKRIPRGQNNQLKISNKQLPKDEWSNCANVHLEHTTLSSAELEKQAEDLVKLLDQVDCVSGTQPEKVRNNTKINNAKVTNIDQKKNNLVNSLGRSPKSNNISISNSGVAYNNKENINRNQLNKINNSYKRSISADHHHSTTDINDSDLDSVYPYEKFSTQYKSVPALPTTIHYDNEDQIHKNYPHLINHNDTENFMSVDNLYSNRGKRLTSPKNYSRNEYKSADNLTDVSIPGNRKLKEYRPYENLRSGFSSTTDIKMNEPDFYRTKVGNIIKRLNSDSSDRSPHVRTHKIFVEKDAEKPKAYIRPNTLASHTSHEPFSYRTTPLSSVEAVRRMSPTRDTYKTKDNFPYKYERDRRLARSTSREYEQRNNDSDYSAKIIITGNNNSPSRYDDDDHAYETYQVGESSFLKNNMKDYGHSSDDLLYNSYKNGSNNNLNMSSIGVQTDGLPKAPLRSRRHVKSMSPLRGDTRNGYGEDLPSASLVRRINHGFGRFDRSPSPTHRHHSPSSKAKRNVVPLLSDTDESEFGYRRKMDPLAKIRRQVMIREKLQEEDEAEEREELLFDEQQKNRRNVNSSVMQPLTVDEVDALTLEVDKRGRNKLVVAHENSPDRVRSTSTRSQNSSSPETKNKRTSSPGIFSTLERFKKNSNKGGEKGTLKKKKKIKIKFFYDPRVQDKPNEDPLERFTEYRGTDSKTRRSSHEDYDNYSKDSKNDFRSLPRESYLAREERRRKGVERRESINRNNSPTRPPRNSSRDKYRDTSRGRDSSSERVIAHNLRNNKLKADNRFTYNSIDRKDNINKDRNRYYRDSSEGTAEHFNNTRDKFSSNRKEKYNYGDKTKINYYESDHSSDQGPSLSDKYKSLRNRESSPINSKYEPKQDVKVSDIGKTKNEKMLRQRNKFFGVLVGEGRSKSPTAKESARTKDAQGGGSHSLIIENKLDKTKDKGLETRHHIGRDREADDRETHQWQSATLTRSEPRVKKRAPSPPRQNQQRREIKYSADSSPSSTATPVAIRVGRTASFQQKYYSGDSDNKTPHHRPPILTNSQTGSGDYRSLPNRRSANRPYGSKQNMLHRRGGMRKLSPGARGSAGSSLQSSESEADSHGGSHASRISTGSNRSVYLHATAIADIPVRRAGEEGSEKGLNRQSKKVSRSFSLISPWKPRHYRDRYNEVDYDNGEMKDLQSERKSALPPRPPRRSPETYDNRKVGRSQTIYKDSKLAGWLRRKRNKDVKGI